MVVYINYNSANRNFCFLFLYFTEVFYNKNKNTKKNYLELHN